MSDSRGIPTLLMFVASLDFTNPHKLQGAISSIIRTQSPKCCWVLCVSLFRQHHNSGVREKFFENCFSQIVRDNRENMVSLSEEKFTATNELCTYVHKSCRCPEQTDSTN
ncbi:hypothetical protein AYI69_g5201 [Smittium culicis]|uniref:Uncharacterized protein n=1 Tax=Smittium culicis TaxID=133412 RepID=A0A1R1Y896_9FUNG|nr:hypothetical protein AYI69_g5201 [Smittium culicis]